MTRPLLELEKIAAGIGRTIKLVLPPGVGFAVMIFDLGEGGHMTYVSNGERADMINALKELLVNLQLNRVQPHGRPAAPNTNT